MTQKTKHKVLELALKGVPKKRIAQRCDLKRKRVVTILKEARASLRKNPFGGHQLEIQSEWLEQNVHRELIHPPLIAGTQSMLLPLTRNEWVLHTAFAELMGRIHKRFERLELELIGPGNILPDTALAISHLLQQRPANVKLQITAHSSLINADLLVFLAGDVRILRPDAWVIFERPTGTSFGRHARPGASGSRCTGYQADYRRVYQDITRTLPAQLADRRIHASELTEWLVDTAPSAKPQTDSTPQTATGILVKP